MGIATEKVKALRREANLIYRSATILTLHQRARLDEIRRELNILTKPPLVLLPEFIQPVCRYPARTLEVELQRIRLHFGRENK